MNGAQRAIKWFAIALAVMIIGAIISAVTGVIWVLGYVLGDGYDYANTEMGSVSGWEEQTQITTLDIELKVANLQIKTGEELKVEANSERVKSEWQGETLKISDDGSRWTFNQASYEVVIYLPEDLVLDEVKIDAGAGQMQIEHLVAERVGLSLGAGKAEIGDLRVKTSAKISGGAGKTEILNGEIKNLDFDMGVGKTSLRVKLSGDTKINAGVGKLDLVLIGEEDDYRVTFDQGIGSLKQDGISLNNPDGKNLVEIDGGVGAVDLKLVAE